MTHHHFNYDITEDIRLVVERLGSDVELLNHKKILVTGGSGFFGRWLLQIFCYLIATQGFEIKVYLLSRNPSKFISENSDYPFQNFVTFVKGDVIDFELPDIQIDYLIHMATTAASETFDGEDQLKKLDLLYRGTRNTLENAVSKGVKKVLFTSSGVVYGANTELPLTEDMLRAPKSTVVSAALGEGKRLAEYLTAYFAEKSGYRYSIARCFSFVGPFLPLNLHYAIGNFVSDALTKSKITVKGTGQDLRSYLYIADAWVWLLKALIHAENEVYNVGSSHALSVGELALLVRDTLAVDKNVEFLGLSNTTDNFSRSFYIPNNEKIRQRFHVKEWTPLGVAIKKTANK